MLQNQKTAITEFEGLRGLLALWVLLGHWGTTVALSFAPLKADLWNVQAVDVFIILSGFVIALLLSRGPQDYVEYLQRRWLRLWPTFIVVMAISLAFMPYAQTVLEQGGGVMRETRLEIMANSLHYFWQNILTHIFMLHGAVPNRFVPQGAYAFVGQAWSISLEWQFYIVAPFIMWALRYRHNKFVLAALIVSIALIIAPSRYFTPAYLGNKLHLFAIGALSFYLWQRMVNEGRWISLKHMRQITLAIIAVAAITRFEALLGIAVWAAALHIVLASRHPAQAKEGRAAALLNLRPVQYLGYISYPLYMVHFIVMLAVAGALHPLALPPAQFAAALLVLATLGSIAAAALLSVLVERPGMALAKRLKRKPAPGMASTASA